MSNVWQVKEAKARFSELLATSLAEGPQIATYHILAVDAAAFRDWAKLMHRRSDTLMQDAMIAAVAIVHRLVVVTRNVRDFEPFGVPIINSFADQRGETG